MNRPLPVRGGDEGPVLAATLAAFVMIAHQVGGKAVRDGLFLSAFDVATLPRMVIAASFLTIGAVLLASRMLSRLGPGRLVPFAFLASGLAQIGFGLLADRAPRPVAVGFYVHMAVFGAVLISWFWSMVNECFDPSTARRRIGRIAGGGTIGGLLGGIAAERITAVFSVDPMLPALGVLHLVGAGLAARVGRRPPGAGAEPGPASPAEAPPGGAREGIRVLRETPYLRRLAGLVLAGTVAAGLLDWVFKSRATATFADADDLVRFFGLFYTTVALATFLVQSTLTRRALRRLQPAGTASALPLAVGIGGLVAALLPGLPAAAAVRGGESAVRSSLFRSAYELFYGPLPRRVKRSTKTLVDVGFDRLGDALGGGVVQLVLATGAAAAPVLSGIAAALGFLGLAMGRSLHAGYVGALARSLVDRDRGGSAPPPDDPEVTQSVYLGTVAHLELSGPLPDLGDEVGRSLSSGLTETAVLPVPGDTPPAATGSDPAAGSPAGPATEEPSDPLLERARELRSRDPGRVRRALRAGGELPGELVPLAVPLLAWDVVAGDAIRALRRVADRHPGPLLDSLLDPDEEFAIRRRVPRVLASCTGERAIEGLLRALVDRRFEVRYQSGICLARIRERRPDAPIDRERILAAVEAEARVDRRVWEGRRILDELPAAERSPFHDEVLRDRTSRTLEHVFTMLSLAFPPEPLRIAYRGLHASDRALRGTALEYLDSILPPSIRRALAPFLAPDEDVPAAPSDPDAVLDSLLRSQESIRLDLEALRRRGVIDPDGDPPASGDRPSA